MPTNILSILDEIRAISIEGLTYTKDKFDIDRYNKLMEITAGEYSKILDLPKNKIINELRKEVGCITPKLGIDVAITNSERKLLILKRADDDSWSLPGGWVDVGEEPFDTAIRESREEAGVEIKPLGYIAISAKGPHLYPQLTYQINILVATKPVGKDISVGLSHEHSEYGWVSEDDANTINWHPGHAKLFKPIFNYVKSGRYIPHY
jgi:8-oxo-dGTP pyrophosphatase MutT (NUDIX family)